MKKQVMGIEPNERFLKLVETRILLERRNARSIHFTFVSTPFQLFYKLTSKRDVVVFFYEQQRKYRKN